jgi:hypothetical protein
MLHRLLRRARVAFLGVAVLLAATGGWAQTYVLASPDSTLNSDGWAFNGGNLSAFRAAITDAANFGPSGTVRISITARDLATVDSSTLSGVDGLIVPWWNNGQSSAYTSAIVSAFQNGMDLWLLEDDGSHNGIGTALGIVQSGADGSVTNGTGSFFNGPFGSATNVGTYGNFAQFDSTTITSLGGTVIGRNASNQITVVYWAPGTFSANSGALILFSDVDMISTYGGSHYSPTLSANGIFALNATAVMVQTIPEPSTVALLALGGLLVGLRLRRRRS